MMAYAKLESLDKAEVQVDYGMTVKDIKKLLGVQSSQDSKVVTITPEMASILLKATNKRNRDLRSKRVDFFARAIKGGDWHLTQDALSFDENGILTNGQHRLSAIAKSGKSVQMLVVFGVEASTAIDTGAKRTFTDNVKIGNDCDSRIKDKKVMHQVFSMAYTYTSGNQNRLNITPDKLVSLMNLYADDLLECFDADLFSNINTKGCNSLPVKTAIFLARLNGVDIDTLKNLVDVLKSGIISSDFDRPIIGLRDKLMAMSNETGREGNLKKIMYTMACIYKLTKQSTSKTIKPALVYNWDFK